MGRGGGGGSSHHSSHHSSSHSHSGGSKRGSSSSSRSYSSHSSSSHHSRTSHYKSGYRNGGYYDENGYRQSSSNSGCGCFAPILFIFVIVGMMSFIVLKQQGRATIFDNITPQSIVDGSFLPIERSTIQREPLPASKCEEVDFWYQDDWGTWIDDSDEEFSLRVGLKSFYEETGVQPYLWIMGEEGEKYKSEGSLEELGNAKYKELFGDDEGHLLVIFREYPDSSGNYICTVTPGYDAEIQVMDDQAKEILLDCIDYHYTDDCNEGEFFESAFMQAGSRIMTKQLSWRQICTIVMVAIVVVIGLVIISAIVKRRKIAVAKQKAKQAQADASRAQAEANKAQTEFNQQVYQDQLETTYVAVTCPNCGASNIKIRRTTVGYCDYCGTAMKADENGNVVILTGNDIPNA